jgi:hypothetical protein
MLGTDVVVSETKRLGFSQGDRAVCAIGEFLELGCPGRDGVIRSGG